MTNQARAHREDRLLRYLKRYMKAKQALEMELIKFKAEVLKP